jgi:hypothetical protein
LGLPNIKPEFGMEKYFWFKMHEGTFFTTQSSNLPKDCKKGVVHF